MSKEIVEMFEYILDIVDPQWRKNPEIQSTLININNKSKAFIPPTLEEVTEELRSQRVRHYQQQAEKFWNFYNAKNWMIGKNKMKNWKSAIKTWGFEKDNLIL